MNDTNKRTGLSTCSFVVLVADDYYEIASDAKYNYSKKETGKELDTHNDVNMWHCFFTEIYFAEYDEDTYTPYTVTINVKKKITETSYIALTQKKSPPPGRLYMLT